MHELVMHLDLFQSVILLSTAFGIIGSALYHCFLLLISFFIQMITGYLQKRDRIAHARKRAAVLARLSQQAQCELDKLQADALRSPVVTAGGNALVRTCERQSVAASAVG